MLLANPLRNQEYGSYIPCVSFSHFLVHVIPQAFLAIFPFTRAFSSRSPSFEAIKGNLELFLSSTTKLDAL